MALRTRTLALVESKTVFSQASSRSLYKPTLCFLYKVLKLQNRMQSYTNTQCMITYKDHKENVATRPTFRLINPAKTDLGRVSKVIPNRKSKIESILRQFLLGSKALIKRKNCHSSNLIFRPCTYPSIGPEFLNRAINFARTKCDISDHEIDIILHCPKTFLFNNGDPWIKKGEKENFDVSMGSYHGAEQCELVGLYLLYLMTTCKNR